MQSFAASKMKKGLRSIFHRKESRSAYPEQREKVAREKETDTNPVSSPAGLLYSLDKEVMEQQQEQQQRLLLQMDSLYNNNLVLNRKLNNLVKDFEEETNRRLFQRYGQSISGRESSFFTFAGLTFFVCMLIIVLYVIIHRDVKRRSHYEKELEESDKKNKELLQSKKNMMLSIAHDLRSPLAIIKESAELLPRLEEKDKRDEFAANICHSSDYMLSLVNTLLEFYLLDTGQIQLNMMPFSLSVFFRETAKNYTLLSKKKRLRFTTRFENLNVIVNGCRRSHEASLAGRKVDLLSPNIQVNARFTFPPCRKDMQPGNGIYQISRKQDRVSGEKRQNHSICTGFEKGIENEKEQFPQNVMI